MDDARAAAVSYGLRCTQIAAERPDDVDLVVVDRNGSERPIPWRELEARANQIARALQSHGVGKDDVVALALPSCAEHLFVTAAFAWSRVIPALASIGIVFAGIREWRGTIYSSAAAHDVSQGAQQIQRLLIS